MKTIGVRLVLIILLLAAAFFARILPDLITKSFLSEYRITAEGRNAQGKPWAVQVGIRGQSSIGRKTRLIARLRRSVMQNL